MTLKEFVCGALSTQGIQQATGVKVSFVDGTSLTIHSDDNPALNRQLDANQPAPTVTPVQSAQGGN